MQYTTFKQKDSTRSTKNEHWFLAVTPKDYLQTKQYYRPHFRTPFEQAAYDIQYRKPNCTSGPDLGSSLTPDISETVSDRDLLLAGVLLAAFIILLIVV